MKSRAISGSLVLVCSMHASSGFAFSGGPHAAITRAALTGRMDSTAIDMVTIANFQVDYIYQKDSVSHCWHPNPDVIGDCVGANFKDAFGCTDKNCHAPGHQTQYFHFENYPTGAFIERGLKGIERGLKQVALQARAKGDAEMLLNALGIALHAVQDMYTHSNIANVEWRKWIGAPTPTLGNVPREMWATDAAKQLFTDRTSTGFDIPTGKVVENTWNMWQAPNNASSPKHGPGSSGCPAGKSMYDPECGVNHDGVLRKGHLPAVLLAIAGTRELVDRTRVWVNDEAFWKKVTTFDGGSDSDGWIGECKWRARRLSNLTGEWGYPARGPIKATIFWEMLTDDCSDKWQDDRWRPVLDTMYNALAAALPKAAPADPDVYGTYDVFWGEKVGTLNMPAKAAKPQGASDGDYCMMDLWSPKGTIATLDIGGKPWRLCVVVDGRKVTFKQNTGANHPDEALRFGGEFTLMSGGKGEFSGFARMKDVPAGIWGRRSQTTK